MVLKRNEQEHRQFNVAENENLRKFRAIFAKVEVKDSVQSLARSLLPAVNVPLNPSTNKVI